MTIEELIGKLKEYPKDMEVVIQYRDDGGCYYGCDDELCFGIEEGKLIL